MSKMMLRVGLLATVMCWTPLVALSQARPNPVDVKAGKVATQSEMKIFISDEEYAIMSESVTIYPSKEWYESKRDGRTTPEAMLKNGWSLLQVIRPAPKQTFWIFVR